MNAEPVTQTAGTDPDDNNVIAYSPAGAKSRVVARAISTLSFSAAAIWAFSIAGYFDATGLILLGVAAVLLAVGTAKSTARRLEAGTLHLDRGDSSYRFGLEGDWKNVRGLTWQSANLVTPRALDSHAYLNRFTLIVKDENNAVVLQDAHDTLGKKAWSKEHRDGLRWLAEKSLGRSVAEGQTIKGFVEAMDIVAGEYRDEEEESENNG